MMNNIEATNDQNEVLAAGARLRNARKQLGLSQQDVAERLCLKISIIRDIEEDRAPADLALTFLHGYIRSYAKLMNIPEKELLPMMAKQTSISTKEDTPMRCFMVSSKRCKRRDNYLMILTWLILFVVISLTCIWWWQNYKNQQKEVITIANRLFDKVNNVKDNYVQNTLLNDNDSVLAINKLQVANKNNVSSMLLILYSQLQQLLLHK